MFVNPLGRVETLGVQGIQGLEVQGFRVVVFRFCGCRV